VIVSTTVSKQQNFVGGETMEVVNPATGETIAELPPKHVMAKLD
jgi:hypothetical protein